MPRQKVTSTKNNKAIDLQKIRSNLTNQTGTRQWKNTWSLKCTRRTRGKIHRDQIGRFLSTSNRGMKYVIIFIFMMLTTLKVYQSKIAPKTCSFKRTRKTTPNSLTKAIAPNFTRSKTNARNQLKRSSTPKIKIAISATCHSPEKCSWTRSMNMEESLHLWNCQSP